MVQEEVVVVVMDMLHLGVVATQAAYGVHIPQEAAVPLEALMVGLVATMPLDVEMAAVAAMAVEGQLMEGMVEREVFLAAVVVLAVVLTIQHLRLAQGVRAELAKLGFGPFR